MLHRPGSSSALVRPTLAIAPSSVAIALAAALAAGCGRGRPRVASAEFADDKTPDGLAVQDETVLIALDRPLPEGLRPEGVRVHVSPAPPVPCDWRVEAAGDPRFLRARILTGTPAFRFEGLHGRDPGATGLGVDLGDGEVQWVDLQLVPSLPVLLRAVWEDAFPAGGNLTVDGGDRLRLVFDRPVKLALDGPDAARARGPQDVLLSKAGDRLDDGVSHARFEAGDAPNEISLVLGSRPVLTVAGAIASEPARIERFKAGAPSGIALNGTRLIPMPKVADARGGPGAISLAEVDVELPEGLPLPRARAGEDFPPPGHRAFHTVTPIAGDRAVVAGGSSLEDHAALDQVLVYDPFHGAGREEPAFVQAGSLPHPAYLHTATAIAGSDGVPGTFDDAVLIAGGTDGERSLGDLTLVLLREDGSVAVVPLDGALGVPRSEHAAVAVGPNQVLLDGGRRTGPRGASGLVECAELVTIELRDGEARIAEHAAFRTLARAGHTLTLLAPGEGGPTYALAYGGFGRDRRRPGAILPAGEPVEALADDVIFPAENAAVLSSPLLIDVRTPRDSVYAACDFHPSHLRWGHAAAPLDPPAGGASPPRGTAVLIAGGTVRHPARGFDGPRRLWELPLTAERLPEGHEATSALVFRFDPQDPARSRIEVVPHPAPDPGQTVERVHLAATSVPGLGVVLLGGEAREGQPVAAAEVFLADVQRLCELAMPLAAARARHGAHVVTRGGRTAILLIGGVPTPEARAAFAAVEEVPLLLGR